MVRIELSKEDIKCFDSLMTQYPENVIVSKSKKFIGGAELYELIIILSPAIVSSLSVIIQNIIDYKKVQYEADKNNLSELKISIKNQNGEYEVAFKTSLLTSKEDIDNWTCDIIKKIKECGEESGK